MSTERVPETCLVGVFRCFSLCTKKIALNSENKGPYVLWMNRVRDKCVKLIILHNKRVMSVKIDKSHIFPSTRKEK